MLTRRIFLKGSGFAMVGFGNAPGWLARAAGTSTAARRKVLVAVFQRGAADGLNILVPFGEKQYYDLRPSLAIPRPGSSPEAALDLDGFFGLHPALAPLAPLYRQNHLAIVEAVGSPDPTRSHFDAQDFMESGTPGRKATQDGWLNRALAPSRAASPLRAVSMGPLLPRTMRGPNPAVAIDNIDGFRVRDRRAAEAFETMYGSTLDTVLQGPGRETFEAIRLLDSLQRRNDSPANGAKYPRGRLGQSLEQIARLIKADIGVEVAFTDLGGWDHHVNEAPPLQNLLREFGQALAAFWLDLGDRMEDVALVTMSEFGRTARENGNLGTDHGHANVMFVLGGAVKGGKVYGQWPGLEQGQLYEGRDLAATTDFRDVLGELVVRHLGNPQIQKVFPGYSDIKYQGFV